MTDQEKLHLGKEKENLTFMGIDPGSLAQEANTLTTRLILQAIFKEVNYEYNNALICWCYAKHAAVYTILLELGVWRVDDYSVLEPSSGNTVNPENISAFLFSYFSFLKKIANINGC